MKVACPFCKVEYCVRNQNCRLFQCAVCGCTWRAPSREKNSRIWIFLLSCFVLLLAVFSLVALLLWIPHTNEALSVRMDSAVRADEFLIVSGVVSNKSEKLYGVPDLIVSMKDNRGVEISSQKFSPPTPLLDSGEEADFSVQVRNVPVGVDKISVKFNNTGN